MPLASFVGPDHLGGEVAGNGISKLVFAIISVVAEAERDRIVQGILDGEAAAMAVEMIAAGNSPACLRSTRSGKAARTFASASRRSPQDRPLSPGARARSAALVEQHNWINFLDAAAKAEERAWLDYMRRLFSDATAKIDAVEQSQRWLQPRPTGLALPQPEMPNTAPTTSKSVTCAI